MAAIAGIGASALAQFLQGLGSNSSPPTTSTANPNAPRRPAGFHNRHGHGGMKEMQSAVLNALQAAKAGATSSTGSTSDPNQIIEDAISKVLKSQMAAPASSADGTTTNGTDPTNAPQSFQSILQSFGVTPQQFQNDFSAAVKDAQNGQVNPATAFQNFQPGSLLDITG